MGEYCILHCCDDCGIFLPAMCSSSVGDYTVYLPITMISGLLLICVLGRYIQLNILGLTHVMVIILVIAAYCILQ